MVQEPFPFPDLIYLISYSHAIVPAIQTIIIIIVPKSDPGEGKRGEKGVCAQTTSQGPFLAAAAGAPRE